MTAEQTDRSKEITVRLDSPISADLLERAVKFGISRLAHIPNRQVHMMTKLEEVA